MSEGIESKMSDLKVEGKEPPVSTSESSTRKQKPKKQEKERKDQKVAHKSKPQQQPAKKKQDGPGKSLVMKCI